MKITLPVVKGAALGVALVLTAWGCDALLTLSQPQEGCATDEECGPYHFCEKSTGACLCNSNDACDSEEYCNEQGFCQALGGCQSNFDCDPPFFCDVTSGECLDPRDNSCTLDTHCPFNMYCQQGSCVPGCRDSSDCPLYCCEGPSCAPGCADDGSCVMERCGCVMGSCVSGGCNNRQDCDYGERCDVNSHRCVNALDSKVCNDCSGLSGFGCADSGHECLINASYDSSDPSTEPSEYCTTTCTNDEDCPWGFSCSIIIGIPMGWQCSRGDTCENGTECVVASEDIQGFCECLESWECQEYGMDECVDGGCVVGRACGLFRNLQCPDVGVIP